MISAKFGHFLDKPLRPIVQKIHINPNILTVIGFVITCFAALVIPYNLKLGGVLILVGGLFDMLDGVIARVNEMTTRFGAFLDSVLDRYSDAFIFLSLSWYFTAEDNQTGVILSLGTLVGAFLISYARARAEGLGESGHTGIMERPERIILLVFATLTGWLIPILWIMLILTHVTVVQRVYHVWKALRK